MNKSEAIEELISLKEHCASMKEHKHHEPWESDIEALEIAINALNKEKVGHWIPCKGIFDKDSDRFIHVPIKEGEDQAFEEYWAAEYLCSECGYSHHARPYCPYCGTLMEEVDDDEQQG